MKNHVQWLLLVLLALFAPLRRLAPVPATPGTPAFGHGHNSFSQWATNYFPPLPPQPDADDHSRATSLLLLLPYEGVWCVVFLLKMKKGQANWFLLGGKAKYRETD